ncbi:hypothetical protein VCHA50O413_40335 [Vibrio chagasii]|nr:hypothetical protein VCHA34P126_110002 [Vibrio chagasii]CAH6810281.1 hypothetical protein VCHA36P161_120002 [Vibrio chagasii]CAH6856693.1 hypothetical protein VCHA29O39_10437 [Vibrio chagasii]CAH6948511.1 hypothetical protein VCHA40P238_110170 [Vibrio chagasii]CAH6964552.1 hypothetical protein VCHA34P114_50139 [Vibrio chagasii]
MLEMDYTVTITVEVSMKTLFQFLLSICSACLVGIPIGLDSLLSSF